MVAGANLRTPLRHAGRRAARPSGPADDRAASDNVSQRTGHLAPPQKRGGGFRRRAPPMKGPTIAGLRLEARESRVDRELDDERRAAPIGARERDRIDRGGRDAARRMIAGEGVAVTLVQVGVVIAEVER